MTGNVRYVGVYQPFLDYIIRIWAILIADEKGEEKSYKGVTEWICIAF